MNFLFLMDPLESVIYEKDTSFILMLGAYRKGHSVYFLPEGGVSFHSEGLSFHVTSVVPQDNPEKPFLIEDEKVLSEKEIHALFIRTDPPFDDSYLLHTWLLDHLPSHVPIINNPTGVRTVNEKIWGAQFKNLIPRTLISSRMNEFLDFLKTEKEIIVKPTDGYGGKSVFHLREGDPNARVTFETLSRNGKEYLVLQKYIPEAKKGDKRILLLNGEPIGAVLRVHGEGDHRNNFMTGGKPVATEITERDQKIIEILRPELQKLGLTFVGIDIIGDYLIEVNVTSPTCVQEINRLYDVRLEDQVIEFVESLCRDTRNTLNNEVI